MSTTDAPVMELLGTGDLVLAEPDIERYFKPSMGLLERADFLIGHLEILHVAEHQTELLQRHLSPLSNLSVLRDVGFDVLTLAANHIWDNGPGPLEETLAELDRLGIAHAGGGMTLEQARRPAVAEKDGVRVGVVSYNCVGPKETFATDARGGAAYLDVISHYVMDYASPGGPPTAYTWATRESITRMERDVRTLAPTVDIVVVSLHKGLVHTPVTLADYEFQIAHAAVDAGADAVLSHHAHIGRGIEFYKGKPIYHGLGNFVTVTSALDPGKAHPRNKAWAERRLKLFNFVPDPSMPSSYRFHPDSRHTMLARLEIAEGEVKRAGFVPVWENDDAAPVPLVRDELGERVVQYFTDLTEQEELNTVYEFDDAMVIAKPRRE